MRYCGSRKHFVIPMRVTRLSGLGVEQGRCLMFDWVISTRAKVENVRSYFNLNRLWRAFIQRQRVELREGNEIL